MKQYLAFYGAVYYPSGGMDDFIGDFDTKEEAIECIKLKNEKDDYGNFKNNWANVYDSKYRVVVYSK